MATRPNHVSRCWNTQTEIQWLQKMPERIKNPARQQAFIIGYVASCEKRTEWPDMDKKAIVKTARALQVAA